MGSSMYNFLFDQVLAAGLRLKYSLNTEHNFNIVEAASNGQTLFVAEGNLSFARCITERVDKNSRKTNCATTFELKDN
jgi:hypothetical protein